MQALIIDYAGVLDGGEEEASRWKALFAAIRAKGIPIAILSNEPADGPEAEKIREWEFRGLVDAVVLSGEIGAEKPQRAAYQAAADALGHEFPDCAYVDDNIHYIHAAVGFGLLSFLHTAFDRTWVQLAAVFEVEGEF